MLPFAKMSTEKLCAWITLCGSDIIALIASVKDLPYWLSCPVVSMPACLSNLSVCLFSTCLSLCLTAHPSPHSGDFVHASPMRHHLSIRLPHCHDAVIPMLDLLKEVRCPCFVYLSLPPALPFMYQKKPNIQHTAPIPQPTPRLACVDVQPSPNHYAAFILSSTSNRSWSLAAAVFSSLLFLQVSSKGFMIPLEAMLNLVERDLGKRVYCKSNPLLL